MLFNSGRHQNSQRLLDNGFEGLHSWFNQLLPVFFYCLPLLLT